jgi:hypothetical protein
MLGGQPEFFVFLYEFWDKKEKEGKERKGS